MHKMMKCRQHQFRAASSIATSLALLSLAACGNSTNDGGEGNAVDSVGGSPTMQQATGSGAQSGAMPAETPGVGAPGATGVNAPGAMGGSTQPAPLMPGTNPAPVGATGAMGPTGAAGATGATGAVGSMPMLGPTGASAAPVDEQPGQPNDAMTDGMPATTETSAPTTTATGSGGAGGAMGLPEEMLGNGGVAGSGGMMGSGEITEPDPCPPAMPLTGGMEYCSNQKGDAGYGYELWADGGGSGCMTVHGVDATFSASWMGVEDFLARVGLDFNQTQTHTQIGTIKADFQETKSDDGGLTYIGIYGWTVNPLREFYIMDDWGSEKPGGFSSDGTPRDEVGTLVADGETYDVWKKTRENKPAITGDSETFDQYFSIRRTARQCGTISISEHFAAWEEMGLELGQMHEVKLLMEAQFNSGEIQFTTATVYVE